MTFAEKGEVSRERVVADASHVRRFGGESHHNEPDGATVSPRARLAWLV